MNKEEEPSPERDAPLSITMTVKTEKFEKGIQRVTLALYRAWLRATLVGPVGFVDGLGNFLCVPCGERLMMAGLQFKTVKDLTDHGAKDCCNLCNTRTKSPDAGELGKKDGAP